MPELEKSLRTCPQGHQYYKSTDCPSCPICEAAKKPEKGFLSLISAPARRALAGIGVDSLSTLAKHSAREILQLHGMGKAGVKILQKALADAGLSFKEK